MIGKHMIIGKIKIKWEMSKPSLNHVSCRTITEIGDSVFKLHKNSFNLSNLAFRLWQLRLIVSNR